MEIPKHLKILYIVIQKVTNRVKLNSHYMETNDKEVNGLQEEKEYESTEKLFHFKEFINKKT